MEKKEDSNYVKLNEVMKIINKYSSKFSDSNDLISISVSGILSCVEFEILMLDKQPNMKGYYNE